MFLPSGYETRYLPPCTLHGLYYLGFSIFCIHKVFTQRFVNNRQENILPASSINNFQRAVTECCGGQELAVLPTSTRKEQPM